ncbi:hypothetical protein B296_00024555 [Ensete ventricosum]|uniref:Uncharacterized protein n=1 Tax=Ensete ventricosum TaxID=4639 RepID=A0A427AI56_ENSVE|nr:hypothetical protein B296_00024555 [Ensete ventricosum]
MSKLKLLLISAYIVFDLLGRNVDGRNIMVQFAKYGPNAERIWTHHRILFIVACYVFCLLLQSQWKNCGSNPKDKGKVKKSQPSA